MIQETVFFSSQLCFSPSLTVWSNSDVRFSGLVLFHTISITQNSLNFNVLRNVTISKIRSICYGGCTEKLNESSTFNKYWTTCCVWDRACSCGRLGSHYGHCFPLMYKLPSQVLFLEPAYLKMKVLSCEKNSNVPCCLISNQLYITCFVFHSGSWLLFSSTTVIIKVD